LNPKELASKEGSFDSGGKAASAQDDSGGGFLMTQTSSWSGAVLVPCHFSCANGG